MPVTAPLSSFRRGLVAVLLALLAGCATTPPSNLDDGCSIFLEKDDWYAAAKKSADKWGVPVHVQLAIIHQESRFKHDAKPERVWILGIIPWFRKSDAFGYAQVKDATWDWYKKKSGNWGADRDEFEDAVDFIGWYGNMTYETLRISKWDAYRQYLAYHEGHGGYKRGTYKSKPWLMDVARKVEARAKRYGGQIASCKDKLKGRSWWFF